MQTERFAVRVEISPFLGRVRVVFDRHLFFFSPYFSESFFSLVCAKPLQSPSSFLLVWVVNVINLELFPLGIRSLQKEDCGYLKYVQSTVASGLHSTLGACSIPFLLESNA